VLVQRRHLLGVIGAGVPDTIGVMGKRRSLGRADPRTDLDRFTQLYEAHVDALFAFAISRTTRDQAAEAVEETFLVAWGRLAQLPDEPRAWLFGVARKVLANQRRAGARQTALGARAGASCAAERLEPDHAEQVVERDRVLGALARLKEADSLLLSLSAWGGLSPQELAEVSGCTKAALLVRLHRARKRLAVALEAEDQPRQSHDIRSVAYELVDCEQRSEATVTLLPAPATTGPDPRRKVLP
jgi:RNA polymerase sigma-70 factor (ECF subfamily)